MTDPQQIGARWVWGLAPLLGLLALLLGWWLLCMVSALPAYVLPTPWQVAGAAWEHRTALWTALATTGLSAALGFGLAALLGFSAGACMAKLNWLRRAFYPLSNLLQTVPIVAIAPLLTIWLGYGQPSVVACAVIVSVFPVVANTVDGLTRTDQKLHELFAMYGFSRWASFYKLQLPFAAPQIFTGLRVAAGLSVIGTVVGEFVSGYIGEDAPIGIVVLAALRESKTDLVLAAVAMSAAVGVALVALVEQVRRVVLRTRPDTSG